MLNLFRKVHSFGPGGYKCPCCGPNPGKGRKLFRKIRRKEMNKIVDKMIKE